jgi:hypothetical protein
MSISNEGQRVQFSFAHAVEMGVRRTGASTKIFLPFLQYGTFWRLRTVISQGYEALIHPGLIRSMHTCRVLSHCIIEF